MKRIVFLILVLLLSLSLTACTPAMMAEGTSFTLSSDGSVLSDGENDFTYFGTLPVNVHPTSYYIFDNSDEVYLKDQGIYAYVNSPDKKNDSLRFVFDQNDLCRVYINGAEDKAALEAFLDGTYSDIRLVDSYGYSSLSDNFFSALNSAESEKVTLPVTKLASAEYYMYDVLRYDKTETFSVAKGAFFEKGDELYYVDYDNLPNNAFDSTGNLSFLRGEIELSKITDSSFKSAFESAVSNMKEGGYEITYESYYSIIKDDAEDIKDPRATATVFGIILGIVLPAMPIIWCSIRIFARKKRDLASYTIFASGVLWIILGIIMLIMSF